MKEKLDALIFQMGHKVFTPENSGLYVPLQVGASITNEDIFPFKDNIGDNIGEWNEIYAEVTGIYWIWKNALPHFDGKYIGQTTYRRPFMLDDDFNFDWFFDGIKNFVIMPNRAFCDTTIYKQYLEFHAKTDINILIRVILDFYPEYSKTLFNFLNSNTIYSSNGFILKKEDYGEYCEFLFDVIDKWKKYAGINTIEDAHKHVEENFYNGEYLKWDNLEACRGYQTKFIGFLSERILNLYMLHKTEDDKTHISTIPYKLENNVY